MIRFQSTPCPVCSSNTKGCSATEDGLHFCRGNADGHWVKIGNDDKGFNYYRRSDNIIKGKQVEKIEKPYINWDARVARYKSRCTDELMQNLSTRLKIPNYFDRFDIGVVHSDDTKVKYSIPERDAKRVIGISVRIEADETLKVCIQGSSRGLVYPSDFHGRNDKVYVVEGFTDAAACYAAGLLAIGRPNNSGGVKLISELVKDREVVIVGENDWRLCKVCQGKGCIQCGDKGYLFPGKEGAEIVSSRLSKLLKRRIDWVLPPIGFKDVREYLVSLNCDWKQRGKMLVNNLRSI